jgi:hypothetical protein
MFCHVGSEMSFGDSCSLAGQSFVYELIRFLFPIRSRRGFLFYGSTNWLVYLVGYVKGASLLVFLAIVVESMT